VEKFFLLNVKKEMWKMKKFLYCLELESGARLIAGYCAATNVAYIIALFSIYSHMDVKKVSEILLMKKFFFVFF